LTLETALHNAKRHLDELQRMQLPEPSNNNGRSILQQIAALLRAMRSRMSS
jgi:hypothetical protein